MNYTRITQDGGNHLSLFLLGIFMILAVFTFQTTPDQVPASGATPGILVDTNYLSKALVPLHQNTQDSCLVEYIGNR